MSIQGVMRSGYGGDVGCMMWSVYIVWFGVRCFLRKMWGSGCLWISTVGMYGHMVVSERVTIPYACMYEG
jgi:hypothetical protein